MMNPIRPQLAIALHRERVAEGLRRASLTRSEPPERRKRSHRRVQLRLRMA
jgi:hypothetical protein